MTLIDQSAAPLVTSAAQAVESDLVLDFLAGRVGPQALPTPVWGPIGEKVYNRDYSRDLFVRDPETSAFVTDAFGSLVPQPWLPAAWVPTDGRTVEVWAETIRRVALGNLSFLQSSVHAERDMIAVLDTHATEAINLFNLMYSGGALPAGRHLWTVGTGSPWSRNCFCSGFSATTSAHVRYLASRLFEGGGVGANYSTDLIEVTSPIVRAVEVRIIDTPEHRDVVAIRNAAGDALISADEAHAYVVDHGAQLLAVHDSREGWVDAWCRIIDDTTAQGDNPLTVVIDISGIRPFGAPLRTLGGTASGPAPFITAVLGIATVLRAASMTSRRLTGLEFMRIDHEVAQSVVAGGTRRSARLALKHWRDADILDFVHCKADGDHWSANISVEIDDAFTTALDAGDLHATTVFEAICEGMARNGEPGWLNMDEHSRFEPRRIRNVNPCSEISLEANYDAEGDAEGESCNIGSVNLEHFGTNLTGAYKAFQAMARFLYRATLNAYQDETAMRIENRNRRIGVGFMGLQGWCLAHGVALSDLPNAHELRANLTAFRKVTRIAADGIADELGLPRPVKVTAIAPTGTISQMFGTQAGGHPVNAVRYIRRVRYSSADPAIPDLKAQGYPVEDAVKEPNTVVVSFPTEDVILSKGYDETLIESASDISLDQFAAITLAIQDTFCGGADGNAVSATGQLAPGASGADVAVMVRPYLRLKGFTAFPTYSMPQMPIEAISKETYDEMVDEVAFYAATYGDSGDGMVCATGACPVR